MVHFKIVAMLLIFGGICDGKIHLLTLTNDERSVIVLTTFGYLKGGFLEVNITNLKISTNNPQPLIGFSFDKSSSSGTSSYVEREESTHGCVLDDVGTGTFEDVPRAILKIVRKKDGDYELQIKDRSLKGLRFYANAEEYNAEHGIVSPTEPPLSTTKPSPDSKTEKETEDGKETEKSDDDNKSPSPDDKEPSPQDGDTEAKSPEQRKKRVAVPPDSDKDSKKDSEIDDKSADKPEEKSVEDAKYKSLHPLPISGGPSTGMNLTFYVKMDSDEQKGLYELYFHNCLNSDRIRDPDVQLVKASFVAHIVEMNGDSYLSAGDMALPLMYGIVSLLFFIVGVIWIRLICTTDEKVFKIHYLMAVIIFIKGLSVMFHSLDYFFIAKDGHTEAWAVIFYIVHLLKGILLIICLLLIGTGWAFIKYILSDRDKKLFMIVIPMQVMVNIAYIIMEETEEGNKSYDTWKNIVILVDVLCCGAILVPVVWSIRHLQEASQTDGKAAINLAKLQLFRHFYVMVVCYLYFTRIIVYLLEITLPFQYIWIHAFFSELGAFVFFSVTGYKFRPGCDNPYLKLDQYDSDEDPEEALTQSGATENITRVNKHEKDVTETDEFDVLLPKQRTTKI